jgi:hypothetical protein
MLRGYFILQMTSNFDSFKFKNKKMVIFLKEPAKNLL